MKSLQEVQNWLNALAYSSQAGTTRTGVTAAAYNWDDTVEIIRNGRAQTILFDVVDGKAQNTLSQEVLDWVAKGNEIKPFDTAILIDEAWATLRARRNAILSETDWTQMPDAPVDTAAWANYRQALRDMTDGLDDPLQAIWPEKP